MYKMVAYSREDGYKFYSQIANNLEWFERYKNRKNYRIEIYKRVGKKFKLIYRET